MKINSNKTVNFSKDDRRVLEFTFIKKLVSSSEPRIVSLNVVRVEFEREARRRGVILRLDHRHISTQFVVPSILLIHFRSIKVEE